MGNPFICVWTRMFSLEHTSNMETPFHCLHTAYNHCDILIFIETDLPKAPEEYFRYICKINFWRSQKSSVNPMPCPDVAEYMSRVANCDPLVSSHISGSIQGRSHVCPKPRVSLNWWIKVSFSPTRNVVSDKYRRFRNWIVAGCWFPEVDSQPHLISLKYHWMGK